MKLISAALVGSFAYAVKLKSDIEDENVSYSGEDDSDESSDSGEDVVVIDAGTYTIKAGWAGEEAPEVVFPTITGKPKSDLTERELAGLLATKGDRSYLNNSLLSKEEIEYEQQFFVGDEITAENRHLLDINDATIFSTYLGPDISIAVWCYIFYKLEVSPSDFHVFIADIAPLASDRYFREPLTNVMFQKLNVKALHMRWQQSLSLYESGNTTGLVVDIGELKTRFYPVYEGSPLLHCASSMEIGGNHVTDNFKQHLLWNDEFKNHEKRFPMNVGVYPNDSETWVKSDYVQLRCPDGSWVESDSMVSPDCFSQIRHYDSIYGSKNIRSLAVTCGLNWQTFSNIIIKRKRKANSNLLTIDKSLLRTIFRFLAPKKCLRSIKETMCRVHLYSTILEQGRTHHGTYNRTYNFVKDPKNQKRIEFPDGTIITSNELESQQRKR